jgi:hypothetical protein
MDEDGECFETDELLAPFEYVEIESDYLKQMLRKVMLVIGTSADLEELSFGPVVEGRTCTGLEAEVLEDGYIRLDSELLKKYDDDVVMAIIAHELAHSCLGHDAPTSGLEEEHEADAQARVWGFDVDKLRAVCGEPTLGE